jgi:putative transposase
MPGGRRGRIAYRHVGNESARPAVRDGADPAVIHSDNGPEFRGRVMDEGAYQSGVRLQFIEPGKPIRNAFIESFNGWLSEECLNEQIFVSLDDARRKIETWREQYNRERPHSSLGYLTPQAFAALTTSEPGARTAWPANQELAGAAHGAPVPKLNRSSTALGS